ncbi:MAG: 16S rRNA (cytosine(1402)-N(4))-methyltransferase RsmH [Prevotellaceae bacterium]|jgi:16S rRNA (cytosine1402-N4)-methyltransferase|nr:16S rRNA (cytosine(1402)-N(4))-methyltransferase RsmH [Prevotellaceae bacterium]
MIMYHVPVLLKESICGLKIKPNGIYVDCTFGGGGHSAAILENLGAEGKLFAFDQDLDAYKNTLSNSKFTFVHGNFKYLDNFLKYYGIEKVDGILADLGVSSHHFDESKRGFSYRFDGKLDMRMNQKSELTAEKVLNDYAEERLADVFYQYGELRNSRQIAKKIVVERAKMRIETIFQFVEILKPFYAKGRENKELAPIFQAIRIEVNGELNSLKMLLEQSVKMLANNGRIVIITYHSLEDRLVKNFFKTGNFEGIAEKDFYGNLIAPLQPINNKVITATEHELLQNSRSRSAKLRVAEKIIINDL